MKDAAEFLRVSEKTVYRWIQQGVIPCVRSAGEYRFHRDALEAWARYKRIGSGSASAVQPEGVEAVDLAQAIRRGGVHYRIPGGAPAEIYRAIVDFFPRLPEGGPGLKDELAQSLIEREGLASTSVGKGMAIPHPRHPRDWGLGEPVVGVFFLDQPADFKAFDGEAVYVLFVLLCATVKGHLQLLARVSHLLREPDTQALLRAVPTREQILDRIAQVMPQAAHAPSHGA